jgi:hypothetical protein
VTAPYYITVMEGKEKIYLPPVMRDSPQVFEEART